MSGWSEGAGRVGMGIKIYYEFNILTFNNKFTLCLFISYIKLYNCITEKVVLNHFGGGGPFK